MRFAGSNGVIVAAFVVPLVVVIVTTAGMAGPFVVHFTTAADLCCRIVDDIATI